jgi:hypothetical protein
LLAPAKFGAGNRPLTRSTHKLPEADIFNENGGRWGSFIDVREHVEDDGQSRKIGPGAD